MTPLQIHMLLEIYHSPSGDRHYCDLNAPAQKEATLSFIQDGLVSISDTGVSGITNLGMKMIRMWTETPVPFRKEIYVDPRTGKEV